MGEKIRFSATHIINKGDYIDTPEEMLAGFLLKNMTEAIMEKAKHQLEIEIREAVEASMTSNFNIDRGETTYRTGVSIEISPEEFRPLIALSEEIVVFKNS